MMSRKRKESESEAELCEAFRIFDKEGTGHLSTDALRSIMSNLGERLTDEEVEDMIKDADMEGYGQINYEGAHF